MCLLSHLPPSQDMQLQEQFIPFIILPPLQQQPQNFVLNANRMNTTTLLNQRALSMPHTTDDLQAEHQKAIAESHAKTTNILLMT